MDVPLEIVNRRTAFYNQQNFADSSNSTLTLLKFVLFIKKLLGTERENISLIVKPKFESKSMQVQIVSQMNNGKHFINHEIVTENGIETKVYFYLLSMSAIC